MLGEVVRVSGLRAGSCAGEHGTGRNVAPFVEMEWGSKAYELMWDLKQVFDPGFVLNPGVLLNRDPDAHRKFLKPSPVASPIVDRCIECGFCESNCPSRDITLTPRQRIATYKEITRLRGLGENADAESRARLASFEKAFDYDGDATCAADGMCQQKCPVKINTGVRRAACCVLRAGCVSMCRAAARVWSRRQVGSVMQQPVGGISLW